MLKEKSQDFYSDWMNYFNSGEIIPFFQPILSLEKKEVFGYEALARIKKKDKQIESIGSFFLIEDNGLNPANESIADLQKSIDKTLREEAIRKFSTDINQKSKLFLNMSPALMMSYIEKVKVGSKLTPRSIEIVQELGLNPNRIVIEITEAYIQKDIEYIKPLIHLYKDFGFLIAIDDLGSKSSNLDRIGIFEPDIIKVDMQFLRKSMMERSYKEILYTISKLSESLGISLLFEGIESSDELNQAMNFGARYLQGFLFSKAEEDLPPVSEFKDRLNFYISDFHRTKLEQIKVKISWEELLVSKILTVINDLDISLGGEISEAERIFMIDSRILRFYVTDLMGNQISPNYKISKTEKMQIDFENRLNCNWTWRPYFLNHLYEYNRNKNSWIISQPYQDIEKEVLLRTFSKTFSDENILFIDILYEE